jgi:hypothetical protein
MGKSGNVEITIIDGGGAVVSVPGSSVQVAIGCSTIGTAARVFATRSAQTLISELGYGQLTEYCAGAIKKGATMIPVKAETVTAGKVRRSDASPLTITAVTNATPAVVTAGTHGLVTGEVVVITGALGSTGVNGTWPVTVISPTTFSVPVAAGGAWTSGGSVQSTGTIMSDIGAGTCAVKITGAAVDDYYVEIEITKAGTVGTAGIAFTVSLDAGRVSGKEIQLGTSLTYEIPNTGLTATFQTTKTVVVGMLARCSTIAPATDFAAIQDCIDALRASQYGVIGWGGGTHILGVSDGADASDIQDSLEELFTHKIATRAKISARDASPPTAWAGTGESETAWEAAIITDFSAADAKRVQCGAGYYNKTSAIRNDAAGLPRYRRSVMWAEAERQVKIPPNRHSGRVRDGALSLSVDPTNDPIDGFVYHDEEVNPGLDNIDAGSGRFTTARSRSGRPGWYISNPITLAPVNSDYTLYPRGAVMDVACSIIWQKEQEEIDDDVRTNGNGTIYETDARRIESVLDQALQNEMVSKQMISDESVQIDRDNDIRDTSEVNLNVDIDGRPFILQINVNLAYRHGEASTT